MEDADEAIGMVTTGVLQHVALAGESKFSGPHTTLHVHILVRVARQEDITSAV